MRPPSNTQSTLGVGLENRAGASQQRMRDGDGSKLCTSFTRRAIVALVLLLGTIPTDAAKAPNPDKPDKTEKPDKPLKIERKEKSKFAKSQRSGPAQPERSEPSPSNASAPNAPAGSPEPFRLIVERNIFNPNRVGRSPAAEEPPPRVEVIALVGTLHDEDGRLLAFFDSPDAAYQKALDEGETIGGLTVKRITPNAVQLARDDKAFGMRVNQQLRRVGSGEWRVVARDYVRVETAVPVETAPAPTIPSDASAVLRRLMEQRQRQLRQ